jgi:glycosyltransferase involved in cell wall biosynthesis
MGQAFGPQSASICVFCGFPAGCWMKISIVTPNFNGADLLERTIQSVASQDYSDVEYIVMDGGSTDGSLEIIERHEGHITKFVSEKDHGQFDAIAKGFSMATGDILCWLNSDDVYFPWTVRVVARIFSDFPQIQWIMGARCELRDGAVQVVSNVTPFPRDVIRSGAFYPRGLGCIMQEGCFWRRRLYEAVGGISAKWPFSGDYELWLRFADRTDLVVTTALLGGFNHTGKNRSQLNADTWQEEVNAIRRRIPEPLRVMGDRLVRRKAFAQKFLFGRPRLRRYLQSWLCLTMHRGFVLGYDAPADRYALHRPQFSL